MEEENKRAAFEEASQNKIAVQLKAEKEAAAARAAEDINIAAERDAKIAAKAQAAVEAKVQKAKAEFEAKMAAEAEAEAKRKKQARRRSLQPLRKLKRLWQKMLGLQLKQLKTQKLKQPWCKRLNSKQRNLRLKKREWLELSYQIPAKNMQQVLTLVRELIKSLLILDL